MPVRKYPLREMSVGGFWWNYISTVPDVYIEHAASILPAGGIYISGRSEDENTSRGKCFSLSERFRGGCGGFHILFYIILVNTQLFCVLNETDLFQDKGVR